MENITSSEITQSSRPGDESHKRIETEMRNPEAHNAALNTMAQLRNNGAGELRPGIIPELTLATGGAPELNKEYQVKNGDSIWKIARSLLKEEHEQQNAQSVREMVNLILESNKERYPQLQKNPHMIDSSMSLIVPHLDRAPENLPHIYERIHEPKNGFAHETEHIASVKALRHHSQQANESSHGSNHISPDGSAKSNHDSSHKSADSHTKHDAGADSKEQHTIASWYGGWFNGRKTASGQLYDENKMTAASKTIRLGTQIEVTNRHNKNLEPVVLTVNDRGPYVTGRGLDLTAAAARKLGFYKAGIADVSYRVVGYKKI